MNKSEKRIYHQKWREKNRVKIRQYTNAFYQRHKEEQSKRCRDKNIKSRMENRQKWRDYDKKYYYTNRGILNYYKKGAKSRSLVFEITPEEFYKYLDKPCSYCGDNAKGVDRIDSSKGYIRGILRPVVSGAIEQRANFR